MAASAKNFYFLFFLFLVSSLQVQARENRFFSRFTPYKNNNQDQEPSFTPETQNGYGLYGHGSNQFPPTTTTTTTDAHYTSNYNGGSYKEFNNNYYNKDNNYKNWYETEQQGTNDARFLDKGYTTTHNNNKNGYQTEKQGMSDTRFLENGKYYYHVNHENYYPKGYESMRGSSDQGFGTSRGVDSRNEYNNGGQYGNNENSYEFNNSMEEYQNQEEFVP